VAIGDKWRAWLASEERSHVVRTPRHKPAAPTRRGLTPDQERIAHLAKLEARELRRKLKPNPER
jgi:hypothetical protein